MKLTKLLADIEAKTGVNRVAQATIALLLVADVALAISTIFVDRSVRTQLTPPEINKSFWIDGKNLSAEWLEQMGEYVIVKFASATPSSIDAQNAQLLKMVHPSVHGELSVRWKAAASKLKLDAISRHFFPRDLLIDEQKRAVAIVGYTETWIADKKVPAPETKAYLVRFDFLGGHTTIAELRETNPDKPFAPPAADGDRAG
jgi:conjugal transfer pilus assembly protein TraE